VHALRFFSAVDDLPSLVLLGLMGALFHPSMGQGLAWGGWLALTLGLGAGLGLVAHWLFPASEERRESTLILLGIIALGAGSAALLRVSPLFVTVLSGMVFANLSSRKESAYGVLAEHEHSLYAVFLLVAGMIFRFDWTLLAVLVPAYLVVRGLAKVVGGYLGWRLFLWPSNIHPLIGAGLLFQGGMALAIAVSFERAQGADLALQVTTTLVLAVVINELLGPFLAGVVLGRRRPA
jgi:hypothetical protein